MRLLRLPLLIASVAPLISVFKAWRAADARVKGLLANEEAQRQLMTHAAIAGTVYLVLLIICAWHIGRNPRVGMVGKAAWIVSFLIVPMFSIPTYVVLHVRPGA